MPFTTPMLAGARARASERAGIELVMPNPSGAHGVYILHWLGVRALCRPTVHDTMLFRRLSECPAIDPAAVRAAARDVALQGHAGQAALAAAETAVAYDNAQRALARFLLLTGLVTRLDPDGQHRRITRAGRAMPDLETAGQHGPAMDRAVARAAGRRNWPTTWWRSPIWSRRSGSPPATAMPVSPACSPASTKPTPICLAGWMSTPPTTSAAWAARSPSRCGVACDSGEAVLAATRSALADPVAVLKRWITDAAGVQALATRCDWLLDGWERVALLWLSADPRTSRRAVLLEMAPLIPVLPREVMAWTGTPLPAETMEQACRVTSREDAWRTGGAAFALIERNEKLLAMSI